MSRDREDTLTPAWAVLVLLVALLAPFGRPLGTHPVVAQEYDPIDASQILALLASDQPVIIERVEIHGDLRLPDVVEVPFVLRHSRFIDDVVAPHSVFGKVVDLSDNDFRGRVRFTGARFRGPFLWERSRTTDMHGADFNLAIFDEGARFDGADFNGRVTFSGTQFYGEGRFAKAYFKGQTEFSFAGFDRTADFTSADFEQEASFARAEFRSLADFASAVFRGEATFADARFLGFAEFSGARFQREPEEGISATFTRVRFDQGATFLRAFFRRDADFSMSKASQDMEFEAATFAGSDKECAQENSKEERSQREEQDGCSWTDFVGANFSTVRFAGAAHFTDADFGGFVNFDQAVIAELDLREAVIRSSLRLPIEDTTRGRILTLWLDLHDVSRIDGPEEDDSGAQQAALVLVEASARAADDLEMANDARMRRLSIARDARPLIPKLFDWIFAFGIGGYGVRPLHQVYCIAGLLCLGSAARWWRRSGWTSFRKRSGRHGSALSDRWGPLLESLRALLRVAPPSEGMLQQVEYFVFKALIGVLLINAGNVWPVSRDFLEGFL